MSNAKSHHLLRLDSPNCTALIEWQVGRMPVWRHFGARLPGTALQGGMPHSTAVSDAAAPDDVRPEIPLCSVWPAAALRRQANASMDRLDGNPVIPGFGNGLSVNPVLRAHADGVGAVQEWVAQSFSQRADAACQTLLLHLQDASGLALDLQLTLWHDCDVLSLQTTLHNRSDHTLQLDWLACGTLPAPASLSEVAHFSGQWGHEFQWQRTPLAASGFQMQNRHGRSSHEATPACFVLSPTTGDHSGEVIATQLAWSGNHQFAMDRCDDGSALLQAGVWLAPGELRLAAGASHSTPALHGTWSSQGLNGAATNFHRFARQQVLQWHGGSMRARPVHLNTWEAVYFNHDDATLRALAERAAALGVERFVLDDGWFPGRPDDHSGLGDWWPDPLKYPNGLGPLIAHVLGLGMEFGLWVEPEMVNPDSDLFRAHPDWALQVAGQALQLGRQQLVLDIARPEVADYLFDKLDTLLRENRIGYLKWDMNRDLAQAADAQGCMAYARQIPALYALLKRLRAAHPAVEIESCASGGGRMDLGILQHTQRFWTSDNNDAVSRISIQSGAARLFPLEVLGAHVGPAPAHTTGRSQSLGLRCAVALFGHMGVEADVRKLSATEEQKLAQWIGIYKAWRGVLHGGRFTQGRSANGVWWLARAGDRAILGVFTQTAPTSMHHAPLRLHGLTEPLERSGPSELADTNPVGNEDLSKDTAIWRIRLLGSVGQERARDDAASPWLDALRGDGVACSASELLHIGLPLPNMNPESALVFSLELQHP